MKYIDLHVHSNASDGTLTPAEIVGVAVAKHLAAIALTDHDTVQGVQEAVETADEWSKKGYLIKIIPGMELSAAYSGQDIHILGLFIDYKDQALCKELQKVQEERTNRNKKMVDNLAKAGINITMEKLLGANQDAVITRAHFAKYLTKIGAAKSSQNAFKKYLSPKGPYYVPREYMSPKKAIALIKSSGGIPILAHPLLYKLADEELDSLIHSLTDEGLAGIEAIYSSNTSFDESYIRKLADKYHLLITGGSDFHGTNKSAIQIGIGKGNLKIPHSILEKLEEYLQQKA